MKAIKLLIGIMLLPLVLLMTSSVNQKNVYEDPDPEKGTGFFQSGGWF